MTEFPGTQGYAAEVDQLFDRYERISFDITHAAILPFVPSEGDVLDIGAGTGRDAAALAALGNRVIAVEPTAALRERARLLHPSPMIEWIDDGLPLLATLSARQPRFSLVLATAVWMHLDRAERVRAMQSVAPMVAPGGYFSILLRRGPVPTGRRMFHVTATETIALGEMQGLHCIMNAEEASRGTANVAAGVGWTRIVLARPNAS